jgi:probable HAF family extracellular repeat protein
LGGSVSSSSGINSFGEVVGTSAIVYGPPNYDPYNHAFLYSGGTMRDLNTMLDSSGNGWELEQARGISDDGRIIGSGYFGGQHHDFLLTPAVPEPVSLSLLAFGVLFLTRRNRRA